MQSGGQASIHPDQTNSTCPVDWPSRVCTPDKEIFYMYTPENLRQRNYNILHADKVKKSK